VLGKIAELQGTELRLGYRLIETTESRRRKNETC